MSNYVTGHTAEKQAAEYLKTLGFKIKQLNWKTRYCEIDIVAEKDKTIYLIEVKFRQSSKQGYGLDYVTAKKLKQMEFAAEMWVSNHKWDGDYQLAAVGVDGEEISFVDEL